MNLSKRLRPLICIFLAFIISSWGSARSIARMEHDTQDAAIEACCHAAQDTVFNLAGAPLGPLAKSNNRIDFQYLSRRNKISCPPGRAVHFVLGETHLYFTPEWLKILIIIKINEQTSGNCPIGPVKISRIYIKNPRSTEVRAEIVRRGLPMQFFLSSASGKVNPSEEWISSIGEGQPVSKLEVQGGFIEDVTGLAFPSLPTSDTERRLYRLRHTAGSYSEAPFLVSCGGIRGSHYGRRCSTTYVMNGGLRVEYEFRQDRRDNRALGWPSTDGSLKEPDNFIELDRAVRDFLRERQERP